MRPKTTSRWPHDSNETASGKPGTLQFELVHRFGGVASVVMIDLDHFKALNDAHGHAAGDEALRSVAQACVLRDADVFARWGGEEFVAILPGTDDAGAYEVAEKLRLAVCAAAIKAGAETTRVTASLGVAQILPSDHLVDQALERADRALYAAKHAGRDRVVRSSNLPASELKQRQKASA